MILLESLLQRSETFRSSSPEIQKIVLSVIKSILSPDQVANFRGGFFHTYLSQFFDLSGTVSLVVAAVATQVGIFQLQYLIENPLTGATVEILAPQFLDDSRVRELEDGLVDGNEEPVHTHLTTDDIYPFYLMREEALNG